MLRKSISILLASMIMGVNMPLLNITDTKILGKLVSPQEYLNADGTLKLGEGLSASFDLSGWNVELDPLRGPVFIPTEELHSATNGEWYALGSNGNGSGSLNDKVNAIAISGNDVYVGGSFKDVNNNGTVLGAADLIAQWDGTNWHALGSDGAGGGCLTSDVWSNTYGKVFAIAVNGNDVYVGGSFINVNNNGLPLTNADKVARWDGTNWHALGSDGAGGGSLNDVVYAIGVNGSDVFVGGYFRNVNNNGSVLNAADKIARWDGLNWHELGNNGAGDGSINAEVNAIAFSGSNVYIGGRFTDVNNNGIVLTAADYIACWDGTNWNALGSNGVNDGSIHNGYVYAIAISENNVYVGGNFNDVNNNGNILTAADYVARWDGANWNALGSDGAGDGSIDAISPYVYAIYVHDNDVFVGGYFLDVNNNGNIIGAADNIARWDGTNWHALGSNGFGDGSITGVGRETYIETIAMNGNDVYVGGSFGNLNDNGTRLYEADYTAQFEGITGFHVRGREIHDFNGNNFVMRGINYPHAFFPDMTYWNSFANIKATGANTVRVVLSSGDYIDKNLRRWNKTTVDEVANVIDLCVTNELVCVLEVHDTTGYGEWSGAVSLAKAVDYWKEIKPVLDGFEKYVILNIGNEPYGNIGTSGWVEDTKEAIMSMRDAGFRHMLMVDAPNWGGDTYFTMINSAQEVFASDQDKNTVFSVHLYNNFANGETVQSYINSFVTSGLPLVIGEFGYAHTAQYPCTNTTETDSDSLMRIARENGIGYLAWSWDGNGDCTEFLDMVTNFDPSQLTLWGDRVLNSANGIRSSSCEASVFSSPSCVVSFYSVGARDGWILESTESSNTGGTLNSTTTTFNLGDDDKDRQYRAILSFNTAALPDNAVITKVTLRIRKQGSVGTNPFTILGGLRVDIRKPYFGTATGLQINDFQAAATISVASTFKTTPVFNWYNAIIGSTGFPYINKTGTTQFRLRFAKDDNDDMGADYMKFLSGNIADIGLRPALVIEYYVP
jgi:hypothetical protein